MSVSDLSSSVQDYLKVIWNAQEWTDAPVKTSWLADRLGVRPSTVSDTLKRLDDKGLLTHTPYGIIELTDTGRAHAIAMVRRHRLIETFLVELLDYGWDEVHDEAEILEHAVSETMIARIDARLGHPTRDPHGDPIPSADGHLHELNATQLTLAPTGDRLTIVRISDADPAMLRHFAGRGLVLDAEITITQRVPYADTLAVEVCSTGQTTELGTVASDAIWTAGLHRPAGAPDGGAVSV